MAIVDSLKTQGPTQADVDKVREQLIRTREVDLAPGETAEFLGINRPGGGAMGMSILMAVLGVGALTLEFDRVVAP